MKWTTDPVTQVLAKLRDSAALQGVDFLPGVSEPNEAQPPVAPGGGGVPGGDGRYQRRSG